MRLATQVARSSRIVSKEALTARASCSSSLKPLVSTLAAIGGRVTYYSLQSGFFFLCLRYNRRRNGRLTNDNPLWFCWRSFLWRGDISPLALINSGACCAPRCWHSRIDSVAGSTGIAALDPWSELLIGPEHSQPGQSFTHILLWRCKNIKTSRTSLL